MPRIAPAPSAATILTAAALCACALAQSGVAPAPQPGEPPTPYPPTNAVEHPDSAFNLLLLDDDHPLLRPASDGVILTDPGQEPRATLRYTPETGATQRFALRVYVNMASGQKDTELRQIVPPRIDLVCTATVTAGFGDSFEMTIVINESQVTETAQRIRPDVLEQIRSLYKGRTVTIIADDRGNVIDLDIDTPRNAKWPIGSIPFDHLVSRMIIPLPEEPVGIGAKWNAPREARLLAESVPGAEHVLTVRDSFTLQKQADDKIQILITTNHDQIPVDAAAPLRQPGFQLMFRAVRLNRVGEVAIGPLTHAPPITLGATPASISEKITIFDTITHQAAPEVTHGHSFEHRYSVFATSIPDEEVPE